MVSYCSVQLSVSGVQSFSQSPLPPSFLFLLSLFAFLSSLLLLRLPPFFLSLNMGDRPVGDGAVGGQDQGATIRGLEEKVNFLLEFMQERESREARVSRADVIRNPRLSMGVGSSVSRVMGGGGGVGGGVFDTVADPREDLFQSPNPARHQGRYTLSPQVNMEEAKLDSSIQNLRPGPAVVTGEDAVATLAMQRRLGEASLMKKLKAPPTFSGNNAEDEIKEVRDWVEVVDDFLEMQVGAHYEGDLALTFVKSSLRGPAHDWMRSKIAAFNEAIVNGDLPESMRQSLKWGEVKKLLVEAFESPQYQVMKQIELRALRLGQAPHRTLPIFNAAFDKLSRRLYPIGTDFANNVLLDTVLAGEYSTLLEHSDIYLWRDVVKTGPRTLAQWKTQTVLVWSAREVLKASDQRNRSGQRSVSRSGGGPQPQATGSVAVQEMDVSEEPGDVGTEEEGSTPSGHSSAAVQQMQSGRRNNSRRPRGEVRPRLLTEEEFRTVWDKRLCLQCYQPGHRIGDAGCKEKGKPRRKPTQAELKA